MFMVMIQIITTIDSNEKKNKECMMRDSFWTVVNSVGMWKYLGLSSFD